METDSTNTKASSLPSQWELSLLAASLPDGLASNVVGEGLKTFLDSRRRVESALAIWQAAGRILTEESSAEAAYLAQLQSRELLLGSLNIGGHLLPAVPWARDESVEFEEFLRIAVGLSKPEIRMKWWRAFETHRTQQLVHLDRFGAYSEIPPERKLEGDWKEPEDLDVSAQVAEEIEGMRRDGIGNRPYTAAIAAAEYRNWRLTMETHSQRADPPYSLEDCAKKALAT